MSIQGFAYVAGNSPVHRCDARAKILLLLVFSIAIFFVHSWWAMAGFAALVVICSLVARIPARRLLVPLAPVIVLALFSVFFAVINQPDADGLVGGLFLGVRMVVLVAGSFVVCLTSTSTELLDAFAKLISPLRVLRVPVDDIAFTLALAIRFIPVIAEELLQVRKAQAARGAGGAGMSFSQRLRVWGSAFLAVFVGLFRHADSLATAMDARCYGASNRRGTLR